MKELDIGDPIQIKDFYNHEWGRVESRISLRASLDAFHRMGILSDFIKGKKVLDGGCGTGAFSVIMAKHYDAQVTSVDIEERCIKIAEKLALDNHIKNMEFHVANLINLPFPNEFFDAVVSLGVIHHTGNADECLKSFYRILKPGGTIFLSVQRECFSTAIKRIVNKKYRNLPDIIRMPLMYAPVYAVMWFLYKIQRRKRFTPLSAAVRDAHLCPFHQVETDEGWTKILSNTGFRNSRL